MLPQNHSPLRQRPPKKTLLGERSLNTNASSMHITNHDVRQVKPSYWLKRYRKGFPKFRIFLDSLDNKQKQSLERKIVLLGAETQAFFSNNCTHLITTKPFYEELSPTTTTIDTNADMTADTQDQENRQQHTDNSNDTKPSFPKKPNQAKDPSQQQFFDRAHSLGVEVWSLTRMICIVSALMNKSASVGPVLELGGRHETLNKMLLEEKRYGVSTGHRSGQAPRPTYITFDDYYAKVEDIAGVHRPILVKEFSTPTFDPDTPENERTYPWPKLYEVSDSQLRCDGQVRSPFCAPDQPKNPENPTSTPHEPSSSAVVAAAPSNTTNDTCIPSNTTTSTHTNKHQQQDQENIGPIIGTPGPASVDISVSTSKTPSAILSTNQSYQRVKSNTLTNSQTAPSIQRLPGAPLYENMSRMDRRMVNNQRVQSHLRPAVAAKNAHDQAERRKKDLARRVTRENMKYCENCVGYYQDLDKHLQEESHLAFVRDQNNFKELDNVLQTTRRSHHRT